MPNLHKLLVILSGNRIKKEQKLDLPGQKIRKSLKKIRISKKRLKKSDINLFKQSKN